MRSSCKLLNSDCYISIVTEFILSSEFITINLLTRSFTEDSTTFIKRSTHNNYNNITTETYAYFENHI